MSVLTESLDRILNWLEQNQPSFASALEPGLSKSEIQEMVEHEFPSHLPTEFYELYQWRNGTIFGEEGFVQFSPGYTFNSLEYALDLYADQLERAKYSATQGVDSSLLWNQKWLPIFTRDSEEHLFILGGKTTAKFSPVLHYYIEFGEPTIIHQSITSMMQIVAECYETGAYYLSEHGDLEIDEVKESEVWLRYGEEADS